MPELWFLLMGAGFVDGEALEGENATSIAEVSGLSPSNIATKIHRIKNLLSRQLADGVTVGAFVHNFVLFSEPWVRVGNVYVSAIFSYVVWTLLPKGPNRRLRLGSGAAEPGVSFLRREFANKRE